MPGTVIESFGSTQLTEVGSHYFFYPVGGSSGPELQYAGAAVTAGQFGAKTPIGAEQTASGYEVAWKNGSADQYSIWNTDSSGNYVSSSATNVSGSDATLKSLETSFHQDLNGDGVIGPATGAGSPTGNAIIGNANSSVLVGSAESDVFVFKPNFGNETVTGFHPGEDTIQFDHTIFADTDAVLSHMQQVGSDVVIAHNPQNVMTLHDVLIANLHVSDFVII